MRTGDGNNWCQHSFVWIFVFVAQNGSRGLCSVWQKMALQIIEERSKYLLEPENIWCIALFFHTWLTNCQTFWSESFLFFKVSCLYRITSICTQLHVWTCVFPEVLTERSLRQDAEGLPVEVKTRSKGDGLYSCSYTPTSPLKHTLAVTWGGVSIPNSPFRVSSQLSNSLIKSASLSVVQSDAVVKVGRSELTETAQSNCKEVSWNVKKPLIIITTYTKETYTERRTSSR